MTDRPRDPAARILSTKRVGVLASSGLVMAVGTLAVLAHGIDTGSQTWALTMAFTTFVLFQMFNALNARSDVATVTVTVTAADGPRRRPRCFRSCSTSDASIFVDGSRNRSSYTENGLNRSPPSSVVPVMLGLRPDAPDGD